MKSAETPGAAPTTGRATEPAAGRLRRVVSMSEIELAPELVAGLPVEWARKHGVLPVRFEGNIRFLASDPSDIESLEYLALLVGEDAGPLAASTELVAECIEASYFRRKETHRDLLRDMEPEPGQDRRRERASSDLLQVAEKAPVTQLVNMILLDALKRSASDIHVEPLEDRLRIRYRIDGVLYEQSSPPKHIEESLVSRLKVMARMDIAERRLPQDGTARVRVGEREIDVRVSTVPVAEGERVVLRLLDRESALLPLSCLGMSDEVLVGFRRLLAMPHGMVVVAGPTGSGKTTTLYASLRELDSTRRNILTVEDPVEYQLPDIGQIQVKPKIGLTFAAGLRHILRQDPDVVLVGETRDIETAEIAVRASLTGHLVFTTLHTNDAAGSVLRMVDMGVEPYLLASCLRGVLAQRLVRRLCPSCRREAVPAGADIDRAGPEADLLRGRSVWEPVGCPGCMDGFRGRVGLFEFLAFSESLAGHIRGGEAGAARLKGAAQEAGMSSLLKDGIGKVSAGATSLAEVLSAAT